MEHCLSFYIRLTLSSTRSVLKSSIFLSFVNFLHDTRHAINRKDPLAVFSVTNSLLLRLVCPLLILLFLTCFPFCSPLYSNSIPVATLGLLLSTLCLTPLVSYWFQQFLLQIYLFSRFPGCWMCWDPMNVIFYPFLTILELVNKIS